MKSSFNLNSAINTNDGSVFNYDATIFFSRESFSDKKCNQKVRDLVLTLKEFAPVYFVHRLAEINSDDEENFFDDLNIFHSKDQDDFKTIQRVLRLVKRAGTGKVLICISDDSFGSVLPFITIKYNAFYFAEDQLFSETTKKILKWCSYILADSNKVAVGLQSKEEICVPIIEVDNHNLNTFLKAVNNLEVIIPVAKRYKKKVLVLYDRNSCHVSNLRENLDSFGLFSRHYITYVDGCQNPMISNEFIYSFDVVVIHYSVRLSKRGHLFSELYEILRDFSGLKILFIQDEYDNLKSTFTYLEDIDFDILYTVLNEESAKRLYPKNRFPNIRVIPILTGYVPYNINGFQRPNLSDRRCDVFYRGRELPYHYGTLGREKFEIGQKFKNSCEEYGVHLSLDLNSDNAKRVYGDLWYHNLANSKTMLGTESGSNVFDFNGDLEELIAEDIRSGMAYEEIFVKRLAELESKWKVNMISPKVFEAIMLGTVPILYEGEYSGILVPGRHYISLKKDFSNFNEVVAIVKDTEKLKEIADCAFQEIISNPNYSYEHFVKNLFDEVIDEEVLFIKINDILVTGNYHKFKKEVVNGVTYDVLKNYPVGYSPPMLLSSEAEMHYDFQIVFQSTVLRSKRYLKNKLLSLMQDKRKYVSKISGMLFSALKFDE